MIAPALPTMTPSQFINKWTARGFGESQAAQTWFLDLLRLVGHPDPIERDDRDNFTFEKPVPGGFADAYLAGRFGWEFKGSEAQLPGAFDQLLRYQVYLRTPPLLLLVRESSRPDRKQQNKASRPTRYSSDTFSDQPPRTHSHQGHGRYLHRVLRSELGAGRRERPHIHHLLRRRQRD